MNSPSYRSRFVSFMALLATASTLAWGAEQQPTRKSAPEKSTTEKSTTEKSVTEKPTTENSATGKSVADTPLENALSKLKLPGVKINLPQRCVDVDATLCLAQGGLELVVCTKNSKEHESIVAIDAKAMHVHTALLLLGAKAGNPAMRKPMDGKNGEDGRWIDVPPSGDPVDVFLVFKNPNGKMVEHPINDFIVQSTSDSDPGGTTTSDKPIKFPTHTFIFAGSILAGEGAGPRHYLSDESGDVISLVTFGDELLCLPDFHSQDNSELMWEVDSTNLPPVGTKIVLRLRPVLQSAVQKPSAPISTPEKPGNP